MHMREVISEVNKLLKQIDTANVGGLTFFQFKELMQSNSLETAIGEQLY